MTAIARTAQWRCDFALGFGRRRFTVVFFFRSAGDAAMGRVVDHAVASNALLGGSEGGGGKSSSGSSAGGEGDLTTGGGGGKLPGTYGIGLESVVLSRSRTI